MNYQLLKQEIFDYFHSGLERHVNYIQSNNMEKDKKTKYINKEIERMRDNYAPILLNKYSNLHTTKLYMLLQYCFTVISFEYRHMIWPYEYMAFSRRNGELWERFCKAAWDKTQVPGLARIKPPKFDEVKEIIKDEISDLASDSNNKKAIMEIVDDIFELVGPINMSQDEMFKTHGINHIIDFKSGFGSNEKGNTLRVLAVGKAYKHWDPNVKLLFLVRQYENNNYLEQIKKSNLWRVYCGSDAYEKIDELTEAGICEIISQAVDFENDLSDNFWQYLCNHDLSKYLNW